MVRLDAGRYIIGFGNGYQFDKAARTLVGNGFTRWGKWSRQAWRFWQNVQYLLEISMNEIAP